MGVQRDDRYARALRLAAVLYQEYGDELWGMEPGRIDFPFTWCSGPDGGGAAVRDTFTRADLEDAQALGLIRLPGYFDFRPPGAGPVPPFDFRPWWDAAADLLTPRAVLRRNLRIKPLHDRLAAAACWEAVPRKKLVLRAGGKPGASNWRRAVAYLVDLGFLLERPSGVSVGPRPYPAPVKKGEAA